MMVPRSTIHKQKGEFFRSCFYIIMSSPAPSDISQNNAEALEKQQQEMQQRHEEEQRSLLQLQEAAEARCAERVAQKARREVEAKEEDERQRVAEEEEQQPSKKARGKQPGKYHGGAAVKMGGATPCERCVCAGQDCLVHPSR